MSLMDELKEIERKAATQKAESENLKKKAAEEIIVPRVREMILNIKRAFPLCKVLEVDLLENYTIPSEFFITCKSSEKKLDSILDFQHSGFSTRELCWELKRNQDNYEFTVSERWAQFPKACDHGPEDDRIFTFTVQMP